MPVIMENLPLFLPLFLLTPAQRIAIFLLTIIMLQVFFTFSANKALIASAVFMTNLELCSWLGFENRKLCPRRSVSVGLCSLQVCCLINVIKA